MNVFFPILLFLLGAALGSLVNAFVDRFCWIPRFRSPWRVWPSEFLELLNSVKPASSRPARRKQPEGSTKAGIGEEPFAKQWYDFLPVIGWIFFCRVGSKLEDLPKDRRLPGLESRRFWIRPFLVELFAGLGAVALYFWEVSYQMLLPTGLNPESRETLLLRFAVHVGFFLFLLAASLIDIDDMIIPDVLTVFGTILGLALAAFLPQTLLPATENRIEMVGNQPVFTVAPDAVPLNVCSPNPTGILWKGGHPRRVHYIVMSALWIFWCFAMLNRVWYAKLPFRKAAALFFRRLARCPTTRWYAGAAVVVPVFCFFPLIMASYDKLHPFEYTGLLSALTGMVAGMVIIWGVRLIGSAVLGREAMGFGDVTLMGMIGAFVGWQSCILIFFLAPFAGLILGIINVVMGRGREFPYGPFLCLATAGLVVVWRPIWDRTNLIFELGWIVGAVMFLCLILLGVLLGLWRWFRDRHFPEAA